ncbi:MAG TPA: hypothetical protein VEI06_01730 [Gemmatimonadaceae bacterium]|nr:hypothetical protein [Gemmatimonadaceae bacterium]
MPLPTLLLDMPAGAGARLLTLSWVEQLAQRLNGGHLPDERRARAHDAVRRLRICASAYRAELGDGVTQKHRRRLRSLSTALARVSALDAQLAWIDAHGHTLVKREIPGGIWLRERIALLRSRASAGLVTECEESLPRLRRQLGKRLSRYTTELRLGDGPQERSFAAATGTALDQSARSLAARLETLRRGRDATAARRAAGAARQTRALLEPLSLHEASVAALTTRLDSLQRAIDAVTAAHRVGELLRRAGAAAGAAQMRLRVEEAFQNGSVASRRASTRAVDPRPGIVALASRARANLERSLEELNCDWAGDADLCTIIQKVAADLAERH